MEDSSTFIPGTELGKIHTWNQGKKMSHILTANETKQNETNKEWAWEEIRKITREKINCLRQKAPQRAPIS